METESPKRRTVIPYRHNWSPKKVCTFDRYSARPRDISREPLLGVIWVLSVGSAGLYIRGHIKTKHSGRMPLNSVCSGKIVHLCGWGRGAVEVDETAETCWNIHQRLNSWAAPLGTRSAWVAHSCTAENSCLAPLCSQEFGVGHLRNWPPRNEDVSGSGDIAPLSELEQAIVFLACWGVSKWALQLWDLVYIYWEDTDSVSKCNNVAKDTEFYLRQLLFNATFIGNAGCFKNRFTMVIQTV
jgi:hypothetical protein